MFFGEYLVEKKIIDEKQLVKALIEQFKSIPSLLQVIHDNNALDEQSLVKVLNLQFQDKSDIISAIQKMNALPVEKLTELIKTQISFKKPLGEVLVDLKFANVSDVRTGLEQYITTLGDIDETPIISETAGVQVASSIEPVAVASPESDTGSAVNSAALESLRELGMLDEDALAELKNDTTGETTALAQSEPAGELDGLNSGTVDSNFVSELERSFSEKKYFKLKKIITIIEKSIDSDDDTNNYLNSLYLEFHNIKGIFSLVDSKICITLLDPFEEKMEKIFKLSKDDVKKWASSKLENIKPLADILWEVRNTIVENSSEGKLSTNNDFISNYKKLLDNIQQLDKGQE
jgi:hypothetical protein